jgi:nucleotide-binding universal stress UspA family protein
MNRLVLVPLDGSSFAEHALPYGVLAASRWDAVLELALVHSSYSAATVDPAVHERTSGWQEDQRAREADYLESVAERLRMVCGVMARPVLLGGPAAASLAAYAARSAADLIVMTTHGRGGLERLWLGSVADALTRQAEAPVLLIRPSDLEPGLGECRPLFRHIVVALDETELSERALETVKGLVEAETRVSLLRVVLPPRRPLPPYRVQRAPLTLRLAEQRAQEAADYLSALAHRSLTGHSLVETHVLTDSHPAAAIVHWANEHAADGIALGTHGCGPALRLVLGSVTDEVVRKGSIPVLVG